MERVKQIEYARMSWCAGDVVNIHGDINMAPPAGSMVPEEGKWEVIYPDVDPSGKAPKIEGNEPGVVEPVPADPLPLNLQGADSGASRATSDVVPTQFVAPANSAEIQR
jgi:hypothetical protein